MEFLLTLVVILVIGSYVAAGWSLAPWVPTFGRDLERVIGLVGRFAPQAREFVEIGSGDGRVTLATARAYPAMRCLGVEYFFPIWLYSRIRLAFVRVPNASLEWGDFYGRDLSGADVIFCFGHPSTLRAKFLSKLGECRPGTKLISYAFEVEWIEPDFTDRPDKRLPIRVYTLPGRAPELKPAEKSV